MKRFYKALEKTGFANNRKGFTLIELITTMAIMALLSGALYTLFLSGGKVYQTAHDTSKAQNEARIAMSYITVKIRQNDVVTTVGGVTLHSVDVEQVTTTKSALIIKLPTGPDYSMIYLKDGLLKETAIAPSDLSNTEPIFSAGTGDVIAEGLSEVTFTEESSAETNSTGIHITIDYNDGTNPRELKETVTLRAEP